MSKKPVPKKKQSVSSTRSRYAKYKYLKQVKLKNALVLEDCKKCGAKKRRHFVCTECGEYNGKQIVTIKATATPVAEIQA